MWWVLSGSVLNIIELISGYFQVNSVLWQKSFGSKCSFVYASDEQTNQVTIQNDFAYP